MLIPIMLGFFLLALLIMLFKHLQEIRRQKSEISVFGAGRKSKEHTTKEEKNKYYPPLSYLWFYPEEEER